MTAGSMPNCKPMGAIATSAAACELTNLDTTTNTTAYVHGAASTTDPKFVSRASIWDWKNVSAIHATPKTENTAVMPALNTGVDAIFLVSTLQLRRMMAPATSMTIWITRFIDTGLSSPSSPGTSGRRNSKAPRRTTQAIATRKTTTERLASRENSLPMSESALSLMLAANSGSFIRSWKTGSLSKSLPRRSDHNAARRTPHKDAGSATVRICGIE